MTVSAKKEALENALLSFNFPKEYLIHTAGTRRKSIFGLATKGETGGINTHSRFMTYEELNAYLRGWHAAKISKF